MPILKTCDECERLGGYAPEGSSTCARCLRAEEVENNRENDEDDE